MLKKKIVKRKWMLKLKFKKTGRLNLTLVIVFVIFVLLLIKKNITFGSARGKWIFTYIDDFKGETILVFIPMIFAVLLLAYFTHKFASRHEILYICLWFFWGFLLQIAIHSLYLFSFKTVIESDRSITLYNESLKFSLKEVIFRVNDIQRILPQHSRFNMPE